MKYAYSNNKSQQGLNYEKVRKPVSARIVETAKQDRSRSREQYMQ